MRLWHIDLLPYLPDAQFKGQLRELILIMHQWRDNGTTNHLLINRVMEYDKDELVTYFLRYRIEYLTRYKKDIKQSLIQEFVEFGGNKKEYPDRIFAGWHNKIYLRICMSNLYEKFAYGMGKSRTSVVEWYKLCEGYKAITGEEYQI
jgi:hypothetical protein